MAVGNFLTGYKFMINSDYTDGCIKQHSKESLVPTMENTDPLLKCDELNMVELVDDNDSLQYLTMLKLLSLNDEPGVKHTTDGQTGWILTSVIRNRHSRSGEYDVEFLRRCKKTKIGKHPLGQDLPFFNPYCCSNLLSDSSSNLSTHFLV